MRSKEKPLPNKEKEIKPFSVKHHNFYPCMFSSSIKQGFLYYLQVFNWRGIFQIEKNSPRFKTKEDALIYIGMQSERTASEPKAVKPIKDKGRKRK